MERPTLSDVMLKKEKDVELDKKIEALRRKNEALMKRYQEVEEDKKRAEKEGMILQSPKGKAGDLTITINKSTSDPRVVMTKPGTGGSPTPKWVQELGERETEGNLLGSGRGRRKQLLVTMAGNTKGKRVVSERLERRPGPGPLSPLDVKSPTEDNQHRVESTARGKHQHTHTAKRDTGPQDEVGQGKCLTEECHWLSECEPHHQESERLDPAGDTDLTIPTSKVEQQEYLCWKMEREQIDRERLARHKNAKGQWRRAWDMDKTENMFSDKSPRERERGPTARGGRNAKRGHPKSNADPLGQQLWGKDKRGKNVPVVSSKAKGKDRLTGRARRWDASEDGEDLQASKTSLEEFLEELDALADPDIDDSTAETPEVKEGDLKMESSLTLDVVKTEKVSGSVSPGLDKAETAQAPADPLEDGTSRQGKAEASPPQATEKKVRFSEELIKGPGAYEKPSTGAQNSARSETKGTSVLKVASPIKNGQKFEEQKQSPKGDQKDAGNALDWGNRQAAAVQAQSSSDGHRQGQEGPPFLDASKTECAESGHDCVLSPVLLISHSDAPPQDNSVQPLEHAKSNTEELIDSSLSVLSLESGETHPTHTTSTDKDASCSRWEKETTHVQVKSF